MQAWVRSHLVKQTAKRGFAPVKGMSGKYGVPFGTEVEIPRNREERRRAGKILRMESKKK